MSDGVYWDDGADRAYQDPRCPRCTSWNLREATPGSWWCLDCDLVVTCTRAEWDAMAEQRAQWAKGEHPAQQPPTPPAPHVHVPHDHHPCRVCGVAHATRPDQLAPRPNTSAPAAPARAAFRQRWTSGSSAGHAPDGQSLAWPLGTPDEPYEEQPPGALDPAAAEAALLADMHDHGRDEIRRSA